MKLLRYCFHSIRLFAGVVTFQWANRTPVYAFQSMIALFCLTGGWTNTLLARLLGGRRRQFPRRGLFASFDEQRLQAVVDDLNQHGVAVFPALIDGPTCDRIAEYLLSCRGRYSGDAISAEAKQCSVFDRAAPRATKFAVDTVDLLSSDIIQQLVCDDSVLHVAQAYLGVGPIIDIVTAWWSAPSPGGPDAEAAQLFHFDMDRPRWLKLFIYVTDVGKDNGPHIFVPGTHRDAGIPIPLLDKGYVRLSDDEVAAHIGRERWLEVTGRRGTVILEDTRGLHKGKPIVNGDRLILQVEYASSLFGTTIADIRYDPARSKILVEAINATPTVYQAFTQAT